MHKSLQDKIPYPPEALASNASLKVCVIGGAGYVGLITGVGLAAIGHRVECADINEPLIRRLEQGKLHLHEPGLPDLLQQQLDRGALSFTTNASAAIKSAEIVFVAVGTPSLEDGRADLSQAISAAETIAESLDTYKVITLKSTMPLGSVKAIRSILQHRAPVRTEGEPLWDLIYNPEFLREGYGIEDFFAPYRIVVGGNATRALELMRTLYSPQLQVASNAPNGQPIPYIETSIETAQIIKYSANAFLSTKISFINEISDLCETANADIRKVVTALSADPRIGNAHFQQGLGFGGPCLEKDLQALIRMAEDNGVYPSLLKGSLERNRIQATNLLRKTINLLNTELHNSTIAIWGLAFKAGTNDVRNSPGLSFALDLVGLGATVRGYDPLATENARQSTPAIYVTRDPYSSVEQADMLVITNNNRELRDLDYGKVAAGMRGKLVIDAPGILDSQQLTQVGLKRHAIGNAGVEE